MINENAYTREAGFPDGGLYQQYISGLEAVVHRVRGAIIWRVPR
jgi:hypothetical protein